MNLHDFYIGAAFDAYTYFGAHPAENGVIFRVYAPNAVKVTLYGDFNNWQEEDMNLNGTGGIWEKEVKNAVPGQFYKYVIYSAEGWKCEHCDPYGFSMELRPGFASRIADLSDYHFTDAEWIKARSVSFDRPVNIYEVHLGSWMKNPEDENGWYNYEEIAEKLIPYVKECGYTHIELMPLSEHPSDQSWGYQNTGFFSPTSRYGTPQQLMKLVDLCHHAGIGVLMDFVPVHFAIDYYALAKFDGSYLYEFPHDDVGYSEWGSKNFIHSRGEVASFLQSAASYWMDLYHFDGLRMDAVSRLIYWQGDENRGENERAIAFIRQMNQGLKALHPDCMLIAEDSTAYPKVTAPVENGGLGFDYKWDLGWMNDTLDYFKSAPWERHDRYHKLTFSMMYFYQEHYLLPFSHDEVVHGKATILQKMWGDYEGKFPQARALYLYMMTHPGKKLNFMGNEIGQLREWDEKKEQDWFIRKYPNHDAFFHYIKRLNALYNSHRSLWDGDYDPRKFLWLEVHGEEKCVYAYLRGGLVNRDAVITADPKDENLMWKSDVSDRTAAVFNFSDVPAEKYMLRLPAPLKFIPLLSSDQDIYGGNTSGTLPEILPFYDEEEKCWKITLDIPAFTGLLYRAELTTVSAVDYKSLRKGKKKHRSSKAKN